MQNSAQHFLAETGWGAIITILAFVVLSLISNVLQKRKEGEGQEEAQEPEDDQNRPVRPSRPVRPAAEPQPTDWEAELRRLLQEATGQPTPPSPPPAPLPPPLPAGRTVMLDDEEGPDTDVPPSTSSGRRLEQAGRVQQQVERKLREASASISRMGELGLLQSQSERTATTARQELAARATRRVGTPVEAGQGPRRTSPEATRVIALFRTPSGARQAVLASMILGRPKAFDNEA